MSLRVHSWFLAIGLWLLALPTTAQVNYVVSGDTAYVDRSPNAAGDIVIASTYNGYPVTSIWNFAFSDCMSLTSVTIPDRVTSIGLLAFIYCTALTNVTIPNSVTSIGEGAFQDCTNLTSVTIPSSVTSIGHGAFAGCTGLTNVTIPNSVTYLGNGAFGGCTGLMSVSIPNSVTSIGDFAFRFCANLTSVTIPNSVTSIGFYAFQGCTSLTSVTIPDSVTSIGVLAFSGCTGLTSMAIPDSVTSIWELAFHDCTNLTNLTFQGNAPSLQCAKDCGVLRFGGVGVGATVYYYCGTTGWGPIYGGLPTVMLVVPRIGAGSAGVKPGGFGFTLTCVTNQTIVVEASTNLLNWQPIWTKTPSNTSAEFVDPEWLNHPRRFYRARSN